jgi:hypothetical protein
VFRDKEIKDKEKDVHWFIGTFRKRWTINGYQSSAVARHY